MAAQVATGIAERDCDRALPLLAPAYLWLTVAIFLPLSAMVFFSFMTDLPLSGKAWSFTLDNYAAFFSQEPLPDAAAGLAAARARGDAVVRRHRLSRRPMCWPRC